MIGPLRWRAHANTTGPELATSTGLGFLARLLAGLWAGGAAMSFLVALFPHSPALNVMGYLVVGVIGTATALLLFVWADRVPVWALHILGVLGTTLVTLCIYFSGEHAGGPATDNEMLYVWVAVFGAYFMTTRQLALQMLWVAACYSVVLSLSSDNSALFARWAETLGTLMLVCLLVLALRRRISQLVERLAEAASTDSLTGLKNRRGFEQCFGTEVERASRHGRPLSVIVCDLDHFKVVNDRLGHPAGDAALVRVGELMRAEVRRIDHVARTGGEEFALILPETDSAVSFRLAERLRLQIEETFARTPVPLSMSFGVATFPEHGRSVGELVASADVALYAAKELGRNRTVLFSEEITSMAPSGAAAGDMHLSTLLALAESIDRRDSGTANHSRVVGAFAARTARELGLSSGKAARVEVAGQLHDIGKVGLPNTIMRKPAPLSEHEWEQVRRHPEVGAEILGSGSFDDIRGWVLAHHEQLDGGGYPAGLIGDKIPLEARILAVANAFEAMTADRVYRDAISAEAACAELVRCSRTQFDPVVVEAFLRAGGHDSPWATGRQLTSVP
jgi:diguanylate cyclase (GGDEF)-like protein